ncbi:MAG: hypothetical protein AUK47_14695 [Deltaproteobacteria bacterium CG2_30_63_29]|nr:MAG: hypothetical protein AUK47_14695 [Deltaproteobacteria bacterium CG2_30_63_29]PJB33957.1 MAG: hypothetical protein CO108_29610 [Deltaproteobacteria bacterium CG_4_9_14_3_um_filter_63_12]
MRAPTSSRAHARTFRNSLELLGAQAFLALLAGLLLLVPACSDDGPAGQDATCEAACATQKPAACVDAQTLETYAMGTNCVDGECTFTSTQTTCAAGCVVTDDSAACAVDVDVCAGVVCDQPPTPCHAPVGLCREGVCDYAILVGLPCESGDSCVLDAACTASGGCVGSPLPCQTPPDSVCDGDTLNVSSSPGTCIDGGCSYTVSDVLCADGCVGGRCLGDPCAGVTCDSPSSSCYETSGTCRDGVCDYAYDNAASCDDGSACTQSDSCQSGVCVGTALVCNAPPQPTCKDAATILRPAATGTCAAGVCNYAPVEATCEFGCNQVGQVGACVGDPCGFVVCDSPPLAACSDANTLTSWSLPGSCGAGDCTYVESTTPCAHGCVAGAAGQPAACQAPTGLVIAEILYDTAGSPDTDAFVELAGPAGTSLEGLSLVGINGNGGAEYNVIALSGQLGATGRTVIAHPQAQSAAAADVTNSKVDYQNGPDSLQLRFGSLVLDAVAYGSFTGSAVPAGEGTPTAATSVGQSLSRDKDDTDTNDNFTDFRLETPSPGTASFWPETAPLITLTCPGTGAPTASLSFDTTVEQGVVSSWLFDFGDGSAPVSNATGTATHAFAADGSYTVTVTGSTTGGQNDVATCTVLIATAEQPAVYPGTEQCFPTSGTSYLYHVISGPITPTTGGKLTVRHKGSNPYGPRPYTIEIQTGANSWSTVATTLESKATWQTDTHPIDQAVLEQAIAAMGWLRFRWSYLYNGAGDNCLELTLTYNCSDCFQCPPGELDLGLGCQSTSGNYDYTLAEHPNGYCASSTRDAIYFPATPLATGDGTLSAQSLGCNTSNMSLSMFTGVSGWVDLGAGSAGNCTFTGRSFTVPEAYLDAAVDADQRIRVRWTLTDSCAAGMGCAGYNDPCVKNLRLTYPR